ncbi:PHP domain-containing protein [Actinoplanes sp. NPDC051851]|uniref:PHP domain-containing protein n=1 Tax=Actinoplanes sp. NPDC051851 TaxID=3154753 RepID=UPI00343CF5A0
MMLPPDSHVHSQFSWDTKTGDMVRSCERAVELGLPGIAFTEHLDHTVWNVVVNGDTTAATRLADLVDPDGVLTPPAFDVEGYLALIDECRDRFPGLRIMAGLETGEPHWHADAVGKILSAGEFDRVLGSLHCLPHPGGYAEPWALFPHGDAPEILRSYLTEIVNLVTGTEIFTILAHIDYPLRFWPTEKAGPFDLADYEEEYRTALKATAASGKALEINTRIPLNATILKWWHQEGGDAVSFGSDAHLPTAVGHGFQEASAMAEAFGFRPTAIPHDLWRRA